MVNALKHYGMPRRSGRYPWGSGENPYQSEGWGTFRSHVQSLRKQGLSDVEIARREGITTTQLRERIALEKAEQRAADVAQALKLKDKGYSNVEIGRQMGINESSVRSLLNPVLQERANITTKTSNMLKDSVDEKGFIDIGAGVENHIGISRTKLNTAVAKLVEEEGYVVHRVNIPQVGMPGQFTIVKCLGPPGSEWKDVVKDPSLIKNITAYSEDHGRTYVTDLGLKPIKSVDLKRVAINYAEDGGADKDGVIELRRGVKDLDLGNSKYAQVRIAVDGTHYLKGMAIYSDDLPDGVDIRFNTNKHKTGNKLDALKSMKDDTDNPFGSVIKRQKGAINVVNEEGDWDSWSKTISSQVLSKQNLPLAKQQLNLAYKIKQDEFKEIMSTTNPVVRRQLLLSFADDCDASAVHLKAAALPRQASKVILPVPKMKENEIYAPTFRNGERVVLIRHPHGGTFEIPELVVNNKSKPAKAIMERAKDAVGIHPKVAQKLSGADFDGDTVIVIPNNKRLIKTSASIKGLANFDPISAYPAYPGMKPINPKTKQTKMGEVSNLITDMTIKGATINEIARAVKHSMVVIDSEKHNLNYKQSYIDNGIAALSEKYQGSKRGGASTIVSKASSEIRVPHRKTGYTIDPKTGEKVFKETGQTYKDSKGRIVKRTSISTRMAEVSDAHKLSSGKRMEGLYADYANNMKSLANQSRLIAINTKPIPYSPSAKKVYQKEVDSLNAKLNVAYKNKPIERQAQIVANSIVNRKRAANPNMDNDEIKKIKNQALAEARIRTGAKKTQINISDREWAAIQAGAVSSSKLTQILSNSDLDRVKQLATPRTQVLMTPSKVARAKSMLKNGLTQAEVAQALGVSTSTLSKSLE